MAGISGADLIEGLLDSDADASGVLCTQIMEPTGTPRHAQRQHYPQDLGNRYFRER